MPNNYAFVIGNSEYLNTNEFANIPYCSNDANEVFKVLCEDENSIFNKDKSVLKINISSHELQQALNTFFQPIKSDDLVLFYFAGHGRVLKSKSYHLIMKDSLINNRQLANSSFNIESLIPYLDEKGISKYIVILDACRSGRAINTPGIKYRSNEIDLETKMLTEKVQGHGKILIAAAQQYQFAQEVKNLKHGLFSYYFLEGLKKGIPNLVNDQYLEIRDVFQYVYNQIKINHSHLGQVPVYSSQDAGGKIFISKNQHFKIEKGRFRNIPLEINSEVTKSEESIFPPISKSKEIEKKPAKIDISSFAKIKIKEKSDASIMDDVLYYFVRKKEGIVLISILIFLFPIAILIFNDNWQREINVMAGSLILSMIFFLLGTFSFFMSSSHKIEIILPVIVRVMIKIELKIKNFKQRIKKIESTIENKESSFAKNYSLLDKLSRENRQKLQSINNSTFIIHQKAVEKHKIRIEKHKQTIHLFTELYNKLMTHYEFYKNYQNIVLRDLDFKLSSGDQSLRKEIKIHVDKVMDISLLSREIGEAISKIKTNNNRRANRIIGEQIKLLEALENKS